MTAVDGTDIDNHQRSVSIARFWLLNTSNCSTRLPASPSEIVGLGRAVLQDPQNSHGDSTSPKSLSIEL